MLESMQKPTIAQLALIAVGGLIAATVPSIAGAQAVPGIVLIDVMIVNDDGGTLTNPGAGFSHTNNAGGDTAGTDDDPIKCLSSDGANCYIADGPIGPGSVSVPPIDGYTIDTQCVAQDATSTAAGATFDLAERGEVFCVIMLDDIAPVAPTTSTTTTLAPTTTAAPTTVAPATTPPVTPAPTTVLPETGPDDAGFLALIALALLAAGVGTIGLSRRRIS